MCCDLLRFDCDVNTITSSMISSIRSTRASISSMISMTMLVRIISSSSFNQQPQPRTQH